MAGNRAKEVRHATASGVSDITRTYTPGKAGEANPHALRSITTTGGPDDGDREVFTYDDVGNTESRSGGARDQGFVWDLEGNLAEVTESGKSTAYLYDSSGNRLLGPQRGRHDHRVPAGRKPADRHRVRREDRDPLLHPWR